MADRYQEWIESEADALRRERHADALSRFAGVPSSQPSGAKLEHVNLDDPKQAAAWLASQQEEDDDE
jgi:hypothetical protein